MSNYQISKTEMEDLTEGMAIEELIESIDKLLLFLLFNAHRLELESAQRDIWGVYMTRKVLCELKERARA